MGEFKSSAKAYGVAKDQLRLRLALFEWAVKTVRPKTITVIKTGKIYMPRREAKQCEKGSEMVGGILFMVVGLCLHGDSAAEFRISMEDMVIIYAIRAAAHFYAVYYGANGALLKIKLRLYNCDMYECK